MKVVEAAHREWFARQADFARDAGYGHADARQRQTFKGRGHAGAGAYEEEQFVFFASVQRLVGRRAGETGRHRDIRGDARCQANAFQIERQAVADIDCRRRPQFLA